MFPFIYFIITCKKLLLMVSNRTVYFIRWRRSFEKQTVNLCPQNFVKLDAYFPQVIFPPLIK